SVKLGSALVLRDAGGGSTGASGPSTQPLCPCAGESCIDSGRSAPQNTHRSTVAWFSCLHDGHSRPSAGMRAVGPIDGVSSALVPPDVGVVFARSSAGSGMATSTL